MYPLPVNPTVVVRIDSNGQNVLAVASNIDADLKVVIVKDDASFAEEAANKPFDSTRPPQPHQVLAPRKH